MEIEKLTDSFGARIHGLDLSVPLNREDHAELHKAWLDYQVLVIPKQNLTQEEQIKFARTWGEFPKRERYEKRAEKGTADKSIMLVSNIRENGKPIGSLPDGEMMFHSDGAHRSSPYRATTLYGIKIPSRGGDTLFANLYKAYDALPLKTKTLVENLVTRIVYDYEAVDRAHTIAANPVLPRARHSLVKVHPNTGRKTLYLSRLMTQDIVDMPAAEGEDLLLELFDHCEKPEFVYAHKWKVNDLLIWDNRCSNHARTDFPPDEQRMLRRYTVSEPDAPVEK